MKTDHVRDLESEPFHERPIADYLRKYIRERMLPQLKLTGYKLTEKRKLAVEMIANLFLARGKRHSVSEPRDKNRSNADMRNQVWDAIVATGLATQWTGNEMAGKVTRYLASDRLMDLFDDISNWETRKVWKKQLQRDLIVIKPDTRDANGKKLSEEERDRLPNLPLPIERDAAIKSARRRIDKINRHNLLKHTWVWEEPDIDGNLEIRPANPLITQTHTGNYGHWTRLYTSTGYGVQFLSKKQRKTLLIDGEPTCELDLKASQLRLLYHLFADISSKKKLEQFLDLPADLYEPEQFFPEVFEAGAKDEKKLARELVKKATLMSINCDSPSRARNALQQFINFHKQKDELNSILQDADLKAASLIKQVPKAHPLVASWFFQSADIPKMLWSVEMYIMLNTLEQLSDTEIDVPAVTIHDCVICKESDKGMATIVLDDMYRETVGDALNSLYGEHSLHNMLGRVCKPVIEGK